MLRPSDRSALCGIPILNPYLYNSCKFISSYTESYMHLIVTWIIHNRVLHGVDVELCTSNFSWLAGQVAREEECE